MHKRLAVNGVLKDFIHKGETDLPENNILFAFTEIRRKLR
jgi:hypothetical protein